MGYCTWFLTIALCSSALAASKGNDGTPEPPLRPFDAQDPPPFTVFDAQDPPPFTVFDNSATKPPVIIPFDGVEVEDDDEEDVMEEDEAERKLLSLDFMDTNPKEVEGQTVFEGDMLLTQSQWRAIRERKGLASTSYRWTEGSDGYPLVPFIYKDSQLDKPAIQSGMNHWMEHTCIKFEETTNTNQRHFQYIYGGGCYSYMGMQSQNGQPVSIGSRCNTLGIVAHEIGHAMGMAHEQSRPDRDDYVSINLENIDDSKEGNFAKYSTSFIDTQNIMYDYSSDMHYGSTGFTINGKTTIATKDPLTQGLIGQRSGLSHRDKLLANIMYKCIDKWLAKCEEATDPCQNDGYYGANCECVCPPGTSGSNCETKTGGYYDSLLNTCTEKITTAGTITSPNYPQNYPATRCIKWIQAPECYLPKVTFSAFQLYGKNPYCSGNECCYFDALEIRTSNKYSGEVKCDQEIKAGESFMGTDREMILFFRTISNYYKGFSAELTFEKQEGCEDLVTTQKPTTVKETTQKPTTVKETTQKPTTVKETTQKPTTVKETTQKPTTVKETTQKPTTQDTTTETTTLDTTTESSDPECLIESYNGVYYWSSPSFGVTDYPNSYRCGLSGSSISGTYGLSLKLITFELQRKKRRVCVDAVKITSGGRTRTLCATKTGRTYTAPSFNFVMEFTSNEAVVAKGFNISLIPTANDCNQVYEPAAGETGTITASRNERLCEYKILAPTGSQVRIDEISPKIRKTKNCRTDSLVINSNSERMYPKESSTVICGYTTSTSTITSTNGEIYLAYSATSRSRGFQLKYSVV